MLSHYLLFAGVGAFYFFWLASFAAVAAVIAGPMLIVLLACVLVVGVAAPLAAIRHRHASHVAVICLVPVALWALLLGAAMVRSSEEAFLAPVAFAPAGAALFVAFRSAMRPRVPRLNLAAPVRYLLALAAAAPAVYVLVTIVRKLFGASAA